MENMQDFLKSIIKDAGAIARDYFTKGVTYTAKSHLADLVTEADTGVSDFLIKKIQQAYPDHSITSEEVNGTINPGGQYEWLIDPVDGTRNFAHGISIWCIIVAVVRDGEPWLGAVYNPVADELFFAEKDHGAFLNNLPIRVNEKNDFEFVTCSFSRMPGETAVYGTHIEEYKQFLDNMNRKTGAWIHQFGCMLGTCYVANGGLDFSAQNGGLDHDYVAPLLIAEEAGAKVTDCEGNPWKRGRQDIVVANPMLHEKIMKLFE